VCRKCLIAVSSTRGIVALLWPVAWCPVVRLWASTVWGIRRTVGVASGCGERKSRPPLLVWALLRLR
jgi:hypothetical protein